MAVGIKMTQEEFIKRASEKNPDFDFSKSIFIKRNEDVMAVCPKHGNFIRKASSFLKGTTCPECVRENRQKRFIEQATKFHNNKYNYSKVYYVNDSTKVEIICPIHGSIWQVPNEHLRNGGCYKCSRSYSPITEEWVESVKDLYDGKYDLSKVVYITNKTPITVICPEHGEFYPLPINYVKGVSGCPYCNNIRKHKQFAKTTEQFIEDARKIHEDKYDYSKVDYYNKSSRVEIICPEHGSFFQLAFSHTSGAGCPKCLLKNQTKLFNKLKESFPNEEILFEHRAEWLQNLRIDIYFPKYNIGVEYDGAQHFIPVSKFGGELTLQKVQQRDKKKNKICKESGCVLFRVPYTYKNEDYEKLVDDITEIIMKYNE